MKYYLLFLLGGLLLIASTLYVSASKPESKKQQEKADPDISKHFCTILPDEELKYLPDSMKGLKYYVPYGSATFLYKTQAAQFTKAMKYFKGDQVNLHEYLDQQRRWNKNVLIVSFVEGGHEIERGRVKETVKQWEACCKVRFKFEQTAWADIKVSFEGGVNDSYIGKESKGKKVSMHLDLGPDDSQDEYNRVVLHEFGHAMGFVHEHQVSVNNPLVWDTAKVVAFYKLWPNEWDSLKTLRNVIVRYSKDELNGTGYDPLSIMCYEIPKGLLKDHNYAIPANNELSAKDKLFASSIYQ